MTTRVVLVDDHQLFREALRGLLEKMPEIEVVGEAGDGKEAAYQIATLVPDLVCMDIALPGVDGIELTRQMRRDFPAMRFIALSAYCDRVYVDDVMQAGAMAYVAKADGVSELARAIESALRDQPYLSNSVFDRLSSAQPAASPGAFASLLGERECQVLRLVSSGKSSKQIAAELMISPGTVEVHRRNIMRKLNLHTAVELTRFAISAGLADA